MSEMTIEITKYGNRHWAVFLDGQLLCVTVYKKGALAVREALLHPMPGGTPETSGESLASTSTLSIARRPNTHS